MRKLERRKKKRSKEKKLSKKRKEKVKVRNDDYDDFVEDEYEFGVVFDEK